MNDFFKDVIAETFASKKQQRYFYAKAGDKSLPKKERTKWGKWSKEFSDKTDFKKLPEVAEDYKVIDTKDPNYNPESAFYYEAIAFIDVKRRIKENLDSFQEVQEFANKMAHLKHAEALQIHKFNETGLVKKSYFIYNQDEDKWEKVKSLPYHEFSKPEGELEEIVDELGNIKRSKLPTDAATKGVTSKSTTDQAVKTGHNQMGAYGTQGTQGYTRYWGESDMSKTLGFDATMKQDATRKDAENYFKNDLEMDDTEAEERLADMGYDPELPDDKVRLVEDPRKFIEEYIENLLSKKTGDSDILNKETDLSEINPIILKQIKSLKNSIESNQISMNDLIKLLKNNE